MADQEPKPHFRIEKFATPAPYQRPKGGGPSKRDFGRTYEQHSEDLKREVADAWAAADSLLNLRDQPEGVPGAYLAFETAPEANLPDLEWKTKGLRLAAAKRDETGRASAAVFVPDEARDFLAEKLTQYGTEKTEKGEPVNKPRFVAIDRFSAARLETLWVDNRLIPTQEVLTWWECWCWPDRTASLEAKVQSLGLSISDDRLKFPERVVIFVYATPKSIARLVSSTDAVAEIRSGRDTAAFFLGEPRADQDDWISSFAQLLQDGRAANAPAVCLLDTGVNRAHPLLEDFLHADDVHAVRQPWGTDDHAGHGTELAGLALHGDLTTVLQGQQPTTVEISLESVKLLPPQPFPPTDPSNFGLVTIQAVSLPEIKQPSRSRVFCLAVGQPDVCGPRATSWSAAIDQAASDATCAKEDEKRRRLFVVAGGNIPDGLKLADLEDLDSYEIEDPGQAWNAITVSGVTQKATITDAGYEGWVCASDVDYLSPYSKVSASWNRRVSPIKPELVIEAGNRAVDPADDSLLSGLDSLSLLTTGHNLTVAPLSTTWATSAAAAQVAGMAARLQADDPEYWPETVRALLVHSAQWTPPMVNLFDTTPQKNERIKLSRRFGYGRPNLERARRSRSTSLAMISQSYMQPFRREPTSTRMNELHFYELPWPKGALAEIAEGLVRLRITLSYFVEPNPSADAPLSPARYRSFGLRFDLRKKGESVAAFKKRISELSENPDDDEIDTAEDDAARIFGAKAVAAGSLHSDEWRCASADLIDRDYVAIYPVGGWLKQSRVKAIANRRVRYSLIVTLDAGDVEQDLYAEIDAVISAAVAAEVEIG